MTNLGVALCTCGKEIDTSIAIENVVQALQGQAVVSTMPRLCSKAGLSSLSDWMRTESLRGAVVAACPARFAHNGLADTVENAGLIPQQFVLVDWREGCAWAHQDDRSAATQLAIDMVRMGIARLRSAKPIAPYARPIVARVLVVGGGLAGMTAARELADRSISAVLVERAGELGGHLRQLAPNGKPDSLTDLVKRISHHPLVDLHLNTTIGDVHGSAGCYHVALDDGISSPKEIAAGAVIIATGAAEMPAAGILRHNGRRIVTLQEYERRLAPWNPPGSPVVYILCAGSRDAAVPYCSRGCCTDTLSQALRVKRMHPDTEVSVLARRLYLPDVAAEELARQARSAGVRIVPYAGGRSLHVADDFVRFYDTPTGKYQEIHFNQLVLALPLVPQPDAGHLAQVFGMARDADGFFLDPHRRLRPERTQDQGIFVAGAVHGPANGDTAILQGMVAAARAARWIERGVLHASSWTASSKTEVCTGCGQCVEACAFGAIRLKHTSPADGVRSQIDPFRCLGCGNCLAVCPSKAIDMPQVGDRQILAQIDAAAPTNGDTGARSLIFACQWSGFAAMELAGARHLNYPASVRVIELPCSTRIDPLHVLYALFRGFERVTLALCPPGECHYGNGNRQAQERLEALRRQLELHGINPERVQVAQLRGDDASAWVGIALHSEGGWLDHTSR